MSKDRGLGRGFDALLPTDSNVAALANQTSTRDEVRQLDPGVITPNPHQPRRTFDEAALKSLAESIRHHGILQPLIVTDLGGGQYQLIAGERRLRAAKIAGQYKVPAIIRSFDEQQKLELALIENIQREELNPIEEAMAYRKLGDEFGMTYEDISARTGKARSTISNIVRLVNLPPEVQGMVADGTLPEGHARQVLAIEGVNNQLEAARLIIENGWTARQAEEFVRAHKAQKAAPVVKAAATVSDDSDATRDLARYLGTKVSLNRTANGGKLIIAYKSDEDLERIYNVIKPR